jgi:hypothetical protein
MEDHIRENGEYRPNHESPGHNGAASFSPGHEGDLESSPESEGEQSRAEQSRAEESDQEWISSLLDISWMFKMAAALLPGLGEQDPVRRGRPCKENFKADDKIHAYSSLFVVTVVELLLRFCVR